MTDATRLMAEANIRDWQRRVDSGEVDPNVPRLDLASDSFENLLYNEILAQYELAAAATCETARTTHHAPQEGERQAHSTAYWH